MVTTYEIKRQLRNIDAKPHPLCNAELRQLHHIILPGEKITHLLAGRYKVGYAIMVATTHRLLIIDKTVWGIDIEDVPYDMIAEVEYIGAPIGTQIIVYARSKKIEFKTVKDRQPRQFAQYLQQRMMETRQSMLAMQAQYANSQFNQENNVYAAPTAYQRGSSPEPSVQIP